MVVWRQWKTGRNRYAQLRRLGVPHVRAAVAAGASSGLWRMSRHAAVQQALSNAHFESLGFAGEGVTIREKLKALEMLGKHIGFFDKQPEVTVELSEEEPEWTADGPNLFDLDPADAVFSLLERSERNRCLMSLWDGFAASEEPDEKLTLVGLMVDCLGCERVRESIGSIRLC